VLETSARLLRLLSLLQSRRDWTGAELAGRLGVGLRTVRRDIDRLRDLGYPVDATPGAAGGYRLGSPLTDSQIRSETLLRYCLASIPGKLTEPVPVHLAHR
jgi:biotin operon repressor